MKRLIFAFFLTIFALGINAAPKAAERIAYIFKEAKISADKQRKLKPFLQAYFSDMESNKQRHDDLKDKYKSAEKAGKLTETQADELMQSKFMKDEKEVEIRRQYYKRFKVVVGAVKAREILDLSNDKIKKGKGDS